MNKDKGVYFMEEYPVLSSIQDYGLQQDFPFKQLVTQIICFKKSL